MAGVQNFVTSKHDVHDWTIDQLCHYYSIALVTPTPGQALDKTWYSFIDTMRY